MLFGKKKKSTPKPKIKKTVHASKSFTQSESFKGFKRHKLTTYKEFEVADTLFYFKSSGYNFDGCEIKIEYATIKADMNVFDAVNVYVNGMRIGCRYTSHSKFEDLARMDYDKVHLMVEDGEVYLFVHYN